MDLWAPVIGSLPLAADKHGHVVASCSCMLPWQPAEHPMTLCMGMDFAYVLSWWRASPCAMGA
jgi:hypothetical protein